MKTYGWKGYAGGVLVAFFALAHFYGWLTPDQVELLIRLAEGLGIIGIRAAVGRAKG